jgi:biotin carboxyl carrier protein
VKLTVSLAGREVTVDLPGPGDPPRLDGQPFPCDLLLVRPGVYSVIVDGRSFEVVLHQEAAPPPATAGGGALAELSVTVDGQDFEVRVEDERRRAARQRAAVGVAGAAGAADLTVVAPMPGRVVAVPVAVGAAVERGQTVVVLEAMKMESSLTSSRAGLVKEVLVAPGQTVQQRQPLVRIDGRSDG